ncbi:MAG: hypothetical protein ACEQSE_09315 [Candidatus Aquirickettsiella gammari]
MRAPTKPICANCAHFQGNLKFPRCRAIKFHNLVTGAKSDADCHPERISGTKCGPEGKLFVRGGK